MQKYHMIIMNGDYTNMKLQIRSLFYFLIINILAIFVSAVPANPNIHEFQQPDSSTFDGYLRGDENHAWYEDKDGYIIVNQEDWWMYDTLESYSDRQLSASQTSLDEDRRVGSSDPEEIDAIKVKDIIADQDSSSKSKSSQGSDLGLLSKSSQQSEQDLPKKDSPRLSSSSTGTQKAIVILINFTNKTQDSSHDAVYFYNMLFNASNPYSMTSYFYETSYGLLNFTGVIAGNKWYASSHTLEYYGANGNSGIDTGVTGTPIDIYELAREAVQLANPDVNFADYDLNSDGIIDHLIIIHSGYGEEQYSATHPEYIWSHSWDIYPSGESVDGKTAFSYTMNPEFGKVGVFAHEMGHDIGLPDLYNTQSWYSPTEVGLWDIMASGSWAGPGNDGSVPSHMSAWCKIDLGWLNPTKLNGTPKSYYVKNLENNSKAYIINNSILAADNEYFIVENREKVGFDAYIPNEGIVIWHIDNYYTRNDDVLSNCNRYDNTINAGCDGYDGGIIPEYSSGDINNAVYSSNVGKQYFNDTTTPDSIDNWFNNTNVSIFVDSAKGNSMKVHFFGGNESNLLPSVNLSNIISNSRFASANLPKNITGFVTDNADGGIDNVSVYQNGSYLDLATLNSNLSFWYNWNPSDGVYSLMFSACKGSVCGNSTLNNITTDKSSPYFNHTTPIVLSISEGLPFIYDINATDDNGISSYSINDSRFSINSSGVIRNNSLLSTIVYVINISVNDTFGNRNSTTITLTVQDTTPPYFNPIPSNQAISYGQLFNYDVNATDISGISNYWLNDSRFTINNSGFIKNNTLLSVGNYSINISVNDTSSNTNSTIFMVTVNPISPIINSTLNGLAHDINITYPTPVNAYGTTTGGVLRIERNGTPIENNYNYILPPGFYEFEFGVTGNQVLDSIFLGPNGHDKIKLSAPLTNYNVNLNLLYDSDGDADFDYVGSASDAQIITNTCGTFTVDMDIDEYFIVTRINGTAAETEVLELTNINDVDGITVQNYGNSILAADKKLNQVFDAAGISINVTGYSETDGNASFKIIDSLCINATLVTKEGLMISLPSKGNVYPSFDMLISEEDDTDNIGLGKSTLVNLGFNSSNSATVKNITDSNMTSSFSEIENTDKFVAYTNSAASSRWLWNKSNSQWDLGIDYISNTTQNYMNEVSIMYATVNKIRSNCSLTFDHSSPINYGTQLNVSCSCDNPESNDATLYRNGTNFTAENNQLVDLVAGSYAYICNSSASENYSSASNSSTFIINKANVSVKLYINNSQSDITIRQATVLQINATSNRTGNLTLYQDAVILNSSLTENITAEVNFSAIGNYNITAKYLGDENYSTISKTYWVRYSTSGGGGGGGGGGSSSGTTQDIILTTSDTSYTGLAKNSKLTFLLSGESHSLTISNIGSNYAEFILASDPVKFSLVIGQEAKQSLSLNESLYVRLDNIISQKVYLTLKQIIKKPLTVLNLSKQITVQEQAPVVQEKTEQIETKPVESKPSVQETKETNKEPINFPLKQTLIGIGITVLIIIVGLGIFLYKPAPKEDYTIKYAKNMIKVGAKEEDLKKILKNIGKSDKDINNIIKKAK